MTEIQTASPGVLYVVGTPIGNLGDMSPRVKSILGSVGFIAAEDTRVTRKLLSHFDLHTPMISYHEHNRVECGEKIVMRLLAGESCALVTDAGMPAISDPGAELVALCAERKISIQLVPGPSAVVSALALSGFTSQRFCFEGFLSTAKSARQTHLKELTEERRTIVLYEAPHKLTSTLADLSAALGDRRIVIARELTKLHEECLRTTLSEAVAHYAETPPRGEFVLIIEGAPQSHDKLFTEEAAIAIARKYLNEGLSTKDAAKAAASQTGHPKRVLYEALIG